MRSPGRGILIDKFALAFGTDAIVMFDSSQTDLNMDDLVTVLRSGWTARG